MHPAFKTRHGGHLHPHHHHPHHGFGIGGGRHGRHRGEDDFGGLAEAERRRERIFGSGDVRLLILHILNQQASHGYEIIRAIGELVGGDYTPSPGTVYPSLTMLEDLGQAQATEQDGGRKRFQITPVGQAELNAHKPQLEQVLARLEHGRQRHAGHRPPEIVRAMENLKTALRLKLGGNQADAALRQRVAAVIDQAALDIERL